MDDRITLRALGALLTYPRPELIAALPEVAEALAGARLLPRAEREKLAILIDGMRAADGLDLEGRYVDLFDRGRATSLNLFEHVHGESRERGQAMVELKELYARAGFRLATKELPDYLPVVLEYLSCRDLAEARAMLGDCAHILRSVGETLLRRGSPYAAVFGALLAVARQPALDWNSGAGTGAADRDAQAADARIDDEWAETPAFAPVADGSGSGAPQVAELRYVPRRRA
ncbi:MAG TPA: nitrate reductase molybdenum cofactor assembly chaperone [Casimicrobiaceae bacterium]